MSTMTIRRVMRTFEVRQVTEDNAVELALWLRDKGKELGAPPHAQPTVSFAGDFPVLIAGWDAGSAAPVGSWVGWGWPTLVLDGDIAYPRLLVIDGKLIEAERYDQGFEEVRLG